MYKLLIVLGSICLNVALPTQSDAEAPATPRDSYASRASKIIALNLLKSNIDIDGNQVHSPLGVTSLLAVLAEAADGSTYEEFEKVFGYPKAREDLRADFKRLLGKYHNLEFSNDPSFQTWLYIYRNYTASEEYKKLLSDNYFVEVKDINREDYDWSEPNTAIDLEEASDISSQTTTSNSKDVVGFETLKRLKVDEEVAASAVRGDNYGEEVVDKEASKFDRVVDDKQYVEKPVIIAEINKLVATEKAQEKQQEEVLKESNEQKQLEAVEAGKPENVISTEQDLKANDKSKREEDVTNPIENETVHEDEKLFKNSNEQVVPIQEVMDSNEPEKVSIPLQKMENAIDAVSKEAGEIMWALESHISAVRRLYGGRSLFQKNDIASALSANSITGRAAGSKTKMLLFNGLYYRGFWAQPFLEITTEFFSITKDVYLEAPMMHARGKFLFADLEHLNAKAIVLPYLNKKYAMAIVVPNDIEGLHELIEKIEISDFELAHSKAQEEELHIILPKFQADETSRSESMLKNLGLKKLFSREEANLSLLAKDNDLHVDELVQFVTVRVDEGGSSKNALSAADAQLRSSEPPALKTFRIDRPFLYFVLDCEERFVIASGKIYKPEYKIEPPIAIEVEFEQA